MTATAKDKQLLVRTGRALEQFERWAKDNPDADNDVNARRQIYACVSLQDGDTDCLPDAYADRCGSRDWRTYLAFVRTGKATEPSR